MLLNIYKNQYIFTYIYIYIIYIYIYIYIRVLITLAKELMAAICVMQSFSNELSWYPVRQNVNKQKLQHNAL